MVKSPDRDKKVCKSETYYFKSRWLQTSSKNCYYRISSQCRSSLKFEIFKTNDLVSQRLRTYMQNKSYFSEWPKGLFIQSLWKRLLRPYLCILSRYFQYLANSKTILVQLKLHRNSTIWLITFWTLTARKALNSQASKYFIWKTVYPNFQTIWQILWTWLQQFSHDITLHFRE